MKAARHRNTLIPLGVVALVLSAAIVVSNDYIPFQKVDSDAEQVAAERQPCSLSDLLIPFEGLEIKGRGDGDEFETLDRKGPELVEGTVLEIDIRDPSDLTEVELLSNRYYEELPQAGWDQYLIASGPTGGIDGWKRGDGYFILGFRYGGVITGQPDPTAYIRSSCRW